MSTQEVIESELQRLHELIVSEGMWNGEDVMNMLKPLHESLLELAKSQNLVKGDKVD